MFLGRSLKGRRKKMSDPAITESAIAMVNTPKGIFWVLAFFLLGLSLIFIPPYLRIRREREVKAGGATNED
jgi:hypothetical protein